MITRNQKTLCYKLLAFLSLKKSSTVKFNELLSGLIWILL